VLGARGSAAPIIALSKVGLGSRLGNGRADWPWISIHDEAAAIRHLLTSQLSGPVNLTGPTPATSDDITRYVAKKLHRPYIFRIPRWVIRAALQEAGSVLLFMSQNVSSERLVSDGFSFRDSTMQQAIDAFL
jgi:NAD dependent epimerase/dehydratase family enzyme